MASITEGTCGDEYGAFTSIPFYRDWIDARLLPSESLKTVTTTTTTITITATATTTTTTTTTTTAEKHKTKQTGHENSDGGGGGGSSILIPEQRLLTMLHVIYATRCALF